MTDVKIQRFDCLQADYMEPSDNGDWVKFSDVEEMQEKFAEAERWRDEARNWNKTLSTDNLALARQIMVLEKALERIANMSGRQELNGRITGPEAMRIAREALDSSRSDDVNSPAISNDRESAPNPKPEERKK
jgi:hypothetical protein